MAIAETFYTLREAERVYGICRATLRAWLSESADLEFPAVARGSKFLVRATDLERAIRAHMPSRSRSVAA